MFRFVRGGSARKGISELVLPILNFWKGKLEVSELRRLFLSTSFIERQCQVKSLALSKFILLNQGLLGSLESEEVAE